MERNKKKRVEPDYTVPLHINGGGNYLDAEDAKKRQEREKWQRTHTAWYLGSVHPKSERK